MQQKYQMRRQKKWQEGLKCNVRTQVRWVEFCAFPPQSTGAGNKFREVRCVISLSFTLPHRN